MYYTISKDNELLTMGKSLDLMFILTGIVSRETVNEFFDENYGTVDTPIGEVPMSMLMSKFLSPQELEEFQIEIARDLVTIFEPDWELTGSFTESIDYDGFHIERYAEIEDVEKREQMKQEAEASILRITADMEGEW